MPNANGQHTDAINSKALASATNAGDDLTQVMSASSQTIAQDTGNQNTVAGSGGDNPGANVQAGK